MFVTSIVALLELSQLWRSAEFSGVCYCYDVTIDGIEMDEAVKRQERARQAPPHQRGKRDFNFDALHSKATTHIVALT